MAIKMHCMPRGVGGVRAAEHEWPLEVLNSESCMHGMCQVDEVTPMRPGEELPKLTGTNTTNLTPKLVSKRR
jgi:hypothetical protein